MLRPRVDSISRHLIFSKFVAHILKPKTVPRKCTFSERMDEKDDENSSVAKLLKGISVITHQSNLKHYYMYVHWLMYRDYFNQFIASITIFVGTWWN